MTPAMERPHQDQPASGTQCFTHYWKNSTWNGYREKEGQPLEHVADNRFPARVCRGDRIYVVTVKAGKLLLAGRMEVGEITDQEGAERVLSGDLWQAKDHLIARAGSGTPLRFDRQVPDETVRRLRFRTAQGLRPPFFRDSETGMLDPQTVRDVRELSPESAELLDTLLA